MSETVKTERNLGIDLLRVLSMFMIVVLHLLGKGGVLSGAEDGSAGFACAWLLECAAYCAVNCYALISGYVSVNSEYRVSRIAVIWLEAFIYSAAITVFVWLRVPESVTGSDWARAFFPVIFRQYWYVTAYFGMFLLMPLLNAAVNGLNRRQLLTCLTAIIIFFMAAPCAAGYDSFYLNKGYSAAWLCIMYLFGAYIRKYGVPFNISRLTAAAVFAANVLVCWVVKLLGSGILLEYTSPFVFFASAALFAVFEKTQIRSRAGNKIIGILAPATLGVYLIHNHSLLNEYYMGARFAFLAEKTAPVLVCGVLGFALAIYIVCSVIDIVRIKVFRLLHIEKLVKPMDRLWKSADTAEIG